METEDDFEPDDPAWDIEEKCGRCGTVGMWVTRETAAGSGIRCGNCEEPLPATDDEDHDGD